MSDSNNTAREINFLIERLNQIRDGDPIDQSDLMTVIGILHLVSEYIVSDS